MDTGTNALNMQPIFIVGYMHSGTTLLRKILGRNSQVYAIRAETMFFEQLPITLPKRFPDLEPEEIREEYVRYLIQKTRFDWPPVTEGEVDGELPYQPTPEQEQQIVDGARAYRDYVDIFVYVFESIAALDGKTYWLEKTPSHIFHVDQILQHIPNARFIEMVRDPRDILASKQVRKHSDWAQQYGNTGARLQASKGYDPLRDSIAWKSAVKAGSQAMIDHPGQILRVHYENLATSPRSEVARICEFLDLPEEEAMLQVGWSNTTVKEEQGKSSGIDASAVSKWKKRLSPDVVATCQWICQSEMEDLGYTLQPVQLRDSIQISRWVARSGLDLTTRVHGLWRERGNTYVQTMLHNSLRRVGFLSKES
ncbi:MAG: sulfotransferase [Chloroflexota bacterium]